MKMVKTISQEIQDQIFAALKTLEEIQGKKFGDNSDPLLVSVRSGARASMPGMMDTILNLGLNDIAVEGFAAKTGNQDLHMIHIEDLFKCLVMLLWKFQNHSLKK